MLCCVADFAHDDDCSTPKEYLDMWNLMAYDFAGTWSSRATHQTNILPTRQTDASVDQAVQFYLSHGVSPHKLVLGMPLYARAFAKTSGLGHKYRGVPEGGAEPGNFNYRVGIKKGVVSLNKAITADLCFDIVGNQDLPLPGHTEQFDKEALACFSTTSERGGEFASYEGPASVDAKCDYIHRRGVGGAMWWELSGDCDNEKGGLQRALIPRTAAKVGLYGKARDSNSQTSGCSLSSLFL